MIVEDFQRFNLSLIDILANRKNVPIIRTDACCWVGIICVRLWIHLLQLILCCFCSKFLIKILNAIEILIVEKFQTSPASCQSVNVLPLSFQNAVVIYMSGNSITNDYIIIIAF